MSDYFSRMNSANYRVKFDKLKNFDKSLHYTLGNHTDEKKYQKGAKLNNTHWGQLKLFTSELLFLTHYYDGSETNNLIYIGAAPGDHLAVLSSLFPNIVFHLYDLTDFKKELYHRKNIKIFKKYFGEDDIKEWKEKKCLLISDIRTTSYDSSKTLIDDLKENEDTVWKDMSLQRKWVEEIKPLYSLLKFRLPYAEKFELEKGKHRKYLDGIVYLQPFCKSSSSETRLCVLGKQISEREWDILSYERKLFHHNSITRNKHLFHNPLNREKRFIYQELGLFNDFDSVYLTHVVTDYMEKIGKEINQKNVKDLLKYILDNITKSNNLLDIRNR